MALLPWHVALLPPDEVTAANLLISGSALALVVPCWPWHSWCPAALALVVPCCPGTRGALLPCVKGGRNPNATALPT